MWYHCTFEESAEAILSEGYDFRPTEWWHFWEDNEVLFPMLPPSVQEKIRKIKNPRKFAETRMREWSKRFGDGVVIWVSDTLRHRPYGTHCLSVDLPLDAVDLYPEGVHSKAFYVPHVILPDRFRLESVVPYEGELRRYSRRRIE